MNPEAKPWKIIAVHQTCCFSDESGKINKKTVPLCLMEEKAWHVNYCYENINKLTTFVDIHSCVVYQHWAPVYIPLLTLECWDSPQLLVRLLFCHPASYSGPMVKIQVKRLWRWFRGLIRSMLPYHHLPLGNPPFTALLLLCFSVVEIQNPGMCSVILSSSQAPHFVQCVCLSSLKDGRLCLCLWVAGGGFRRRDLCT